MNDIIRSLRRSDRRYTIDRDADLTVSLDKCDGTSEFIHAELLDLSARGAKFKIKEPIAVEEVLAVKIQFNDPKQIIATSGKVRRVSPGDDWWFGCEFDVPIKAEVLTELSQTGVLERRENYRRQVSFEAIAKWELHQDTVPVRILDYSPDGGFCLTSAHAGEPGQRVQLQFEQGNGTVQVCGVARWQVETETGYVVGCEQHRNSPSIGTLIQRKDETDDCSRPLLTARQTGYLALGIVGILVALTLMVRPVDDDTSISQVTTSHEVDAAVATRPIVHLSPELDEAATNDGEHSLPDAPSESNESSEPPDVSADTSDGADDTRPTESNQEQRAGQKSSVLMSFDHSFDPPLVPAAYSPEVIELPLLEQSVMDLLQSPKVTDAETDQDD